MEHIRNNSHIAAADSPAPLSGPARAAVRPSERLAERLIEDALETGRDVRPGRAQRSDGWTPDRIRTFLTALSQCGVVADAARAAGMSKTSAYAFRNSARGHAFDVAWRAALLLARRRIADEVMSRAINGCVEVIMRDGEVWGERHRYDNRLTMAVLTRLDDLATAMVRQADEGPQRAACEFDRFVDAVCAGGEQAADFLRSRAALRHGDFTDASIIGRNHDYAQNREEAGQDEWQASTWSILPDAEPAIEQN